MASNHVYGLDLQELSACSHACRRCESFAHASGRTNVCDGLTLPRWGWLTPQWGIARTNEFPHGWSMIRWVHNAVVSVGSDKRALLRHCGNLCAACPRDFMQQTSLTWCWQNPVRTFHLCLCVPLNCLRMRGLLSACSNSHENVYVDWHSGAHNAATL